MFRALQKSSGTEAVYDRICLSELQERWRHAKKTGDKNDYADYLDRLELYRVDKVERHYKAIPNAQLPKAYQELNLPKAERVLIKEYRIKAFEAAALATTTAVKPVTPSLCKTGVSVSVAHPV